MKPAARRIALRASASVLGGGSGAGAGGGTGNGGKPGPSPPPPHALSAKGESVEMTKFLRFIFCLQLGSG
ncbi:hypothetical protein GmRootV116_13860 [Variovorax sp. V116]